MDPVELLNIFLGKNNKNTKLYYKFLKGLKTKVENEEEARVLKIITYYNFSKNFWLSPEQVDSLEIDIFNWFNTIETLIEQLQKEKPTS